MVTENFANSVLDAFFNQGSRPSAFYLGLLGPDSIHTVPFGPSLFEVVSYDGVDRPEWNPSPATLIELLTNPSSPGFYAGVRCDPFVEFKFDSLDSTKPGCIVNGFFLSSNPTKGSFDYLTLTDINYTLEARSPSHQVTGLSFIQFNLQYGPFFTFDSLRVTYSFALKYSSNINVRHRNVG